MKKYIASFSGGKDSTASIILAHENGDPLDLIIFSEVMFDEEISGELPEHMEFIRNKCIPIFESWGYKVEILRSEKTYMDCFNHVVTKPRKNPKNKGKRKGFVMVGHCDVQRECKLKPINEYFKNISKETFVQYVGIAADEPKRLERLRGTNSISLLEKYEYTEEMALELCKKYNLLSPIYDFTMRGGCWFCPNARYAELKHLRKYHRNLWDKLLELEKRTDLIGNIWNTLTKTSMHDNEDMFFWEEAQMSIFDFPECVPDCMKGDEKSEC